MNYIDTCTVRKESFPMLEEAQRKFERFEKLEKSFGKKRIEQEDSLVRHFATGMLCGALGVPFPVFICATQIQLLPDSTGWKVRAIACLFFVTASAIVARHLGFKDFLQFSLLNPVIISNALIGKMA